ncbi:Lrp/AsnC family transcriptional regulator [Nocardioides sp. DS6]|uniref:Lrp/AsnC family transcriptional regulator n=1 Tax=Nocardioides eburneus TaxID=3231482 RepID=A0ABV3SUX4_9ACTN
MSPQSGSYRPDRLDQALLAALEEHPRAGDLELSRITKVARATVQSRLARMSDAGVIAGWGPTVDVAAAGFAVQAFVSLEIAQVALEDLRAELEANPHVLEAYTTTGTSDALCKVAARSHEELQEVLLALTRSPVVVRSTSVVALTVLVPRRTAPLLATAEDERGPRAPAYR